MVASGKDEVSSVRLPVALPPTAGQHTKSSQHQLVSFFITLFHHRARPARGGNTPAWRRLPVRHDSGAACAPGWKYIALIRGVGSVAVIAVPPAVSPAVYATATSTLASPAAARPAAFRSGGPATIIEVVPSICGSPCCIRAGTPVVRWLS